MILLKKDPHREFCHDDFFFKRKIEQMGILTIDRLSFSGDEADRLA